MKKILCVITVFFFVFSLCSCSNTEKSIETYSTNETTIIDKNNSRITSENSTGEKGAAVSSSIYNISENSSTGGKLPNGENSLINNSSKSSWEKHNGSSGNGSNNSNSESTTKSTEPPTKFQTCTNNNNHSIKCGNMGKWFNSRTELENYVSGVIDVWNEKLENGQLDWKEYAKKCPQGFESWSCSYCGKWTGNFKFDTRKFCTEGGNEHWLYNNGEIGWYSSYSEAEKAAAEYLKKHSNFDGYHIQQCDCGLYTAGFYNYNT